MNYPAAISLNEAVKYINFTRFFAYCSEDNYYLNNTISPFPGSRGSWDLKELSDE